MAGETVVPRSYEAATVLFCQLVDFARFLSETRPHDVIRFCKLRNHDPSLTYANNGDNYDNYEF